MNDPLKFDSLNAPYVEDLWAQFVRDPATVPAPWVRYFRQLSVNGQPVAAAAPSPPHGQEALHEEALFRERVDRLVRAYRVRGHLEAQLDPLELARRYHPELDPRAYGLREEDLGRRIHGSSLAGLYEPTLGELVQRLRATYCRSIGVQYMHMDELQTRDWLQQRMESSENRMTVSRQQQLRILTRLTDAAVFEQFVRKKYLGSKTFSLEGAESLIPLLDLALEHAGAQGVEKVVIGMAHRGRLNVLANIIGKTPQEIFREFEDLAPQHQRGRGDVKYHQGFTGQWTTQAGKIMTLALCFNPSHLEFVDPVAIGRTRAKQDLMQDTQRQKAMTLLIHGDAAFAGEGVVQETLNLSQLSAYHTGGTVHIVVNNQLGFTTPPQQGRSTVYATDVARMLQIPILHVNGEHPEAVAQAVTLAMDFRHQFQRDVVIDMFCYRRWGHNEADEPSFTQPRMYRAIEQRTSVRDRYLEHLLELGGVERTEADRIADQRHAAMHEAFQQVKEQKKSSKVIPYQPTWLSDAWKGYEGGLEPADDDPNTGVPIDQLQGLLERLVKLPEGFHLHSKLKRFMEHRLEMARGERPLDWATAEALAMASLAVEGHRVRLTGQDTERGTFSQRHAVLFDAENGTRYSIFSGLDPDQAPVEIYNSPLSEVAVVGFEYGYSLELPGGLVAWEAQFGDFWNVAQVIIDQFLVSAEDKWGWLSGLVMLLPHGFEGQGPEHSSARLERFLTLSAEDNIQVTYPSTPAQYFHLLRRQVKRRWRKPLIVLTPKSLLRHREAVSSLSELSDGRFQRVLADATPPDQVRRVLLCSGKIYYDLREAVQKSGRSDVAVLRIEQLYPISPQVLQKLLEPYPPDVPLVWVQEEPENMGAWTYWALRDRQRHFGNRSLQLVAREASASPATGSSGAHQREQEEILQRALSV